MIVSEMAKKVLIELLFYDVFNVSGTQNCSDRLLTCQTLMANKGTLCQDNPIFAQQNCFYSCGLCDVDTSEFS